jgi:hypothetical protein
MRLPDAIHSYRRTRNTFDAAARAYPAETTRHRLTLGDKVIGHTQVRNIFWLLFQGHDSCNNGSTSSLEAALAKRLEQRIAN